MKKNGNISLNVCMLSAVFGAIIFIAIYGISILDITNVDWIRNAGGDLTQSYYGWRFFRASEWHWPLGLMENIAYPELTSIIYVDSIPLFNIIFKCLSPLLPDTVQFFGLWGILCFILSGVIGAKIVYYFSKSNIYSFIGSLFFIFNNIMVQRLYTHTALAANWLIILCIWIILKGKDNSSKRYHFFTWGMLLFLCVSINMYYIPIIGLIMLVFCGYIVVKNKDVKKAISIAAGAGIATILTFYLYGGFYHLSAGDASPAGLGYYSANLNSLINSMETYKYLSGYSTFVPSLPLATDGQYEGYAYLGFGAILMVGFCIVSILKNFRVTGHIKGYISQYKLEIIFTIISILILYLAALGPAITWNEKTLCLIPYPNFFLKIYSIFRSTGRFLWGVWNILVVVGIYFVWKNYRKNWAIFILGCCICIQILDFSELYAKKHEEFSSKQQPYVSLLENDVWEEAVKNKDKIILFNRQMLSLRTYYDLAEIVLDNDMGINDFYYSRRNSKEIDKYKKKKYEDILNGDMSQKELFVIDSFEDAGKLLPYMNIYYIDGVILGSKNSLNLPFKINHIGSVKAYEKSTPSFNCEFVERGLFGVEIRGERAADSIIYIEGEDKRRLFEKYDGGSMALDVVEIKSDVSNMEIFNESENLNIALYRLE